MRFDPPTDQTSLLGVICEIRNGIFPFLMAFAVIGFIYVGYLYISANGSEEKIERAKRSFRWIVIGVVIALMAFGLPTIIFDLFGATLDPNGVCAL